MWNSLRIRTAIQIMMGPLLTKAVSILAFRYRCVNRAPLAPGRCGNRPQVRTFWGPAEVSQVCM